jgi:hypothetical protein
MLLFIFIFELLSEKEQIRQENFFRSINAVLRIHTYVLGLVDPDPDPLVRGMDPDPDPSIIKQKNSKTNFDSYCDFF